MATDSTRVLRPSAVVPSAAANRILLELEVRDVGQGGVWSATSGLWQRYDQAWDGPRGMRGSAKLLGTIGAIYGTPTRYEITLYRVTLTEHGLAAGWEHDALVDDALQYGDITLAACGRAALVDPPSPDPFKRPAGGLLHGR